MAGKDFEHQVQDRLDGWGMDPSEGVWGKLEISLQRRKRRRRGYIFFLLAGLLAAGSMWYIIPGTMEAPVAGVRQGADRQRLASGSDTEIPDSEVQAGGGTKYAPVLPEQEEINGLKTDAMPGTPGDAIALSPGVPSSTKETLPVGTDTRSNGETSGSSASHRPFTQDNRVFVKPRRSQTQAARLPAHSAPETVLQKGMDAGNRQSGEAMVMAKSLPGPSVPASLAVVSPVISLHEAQPVIPAEASSQKISTGMTKKFAPAPVPDIVEQLPEKHNREPRMAFGLSVGMGWSGFTDGLLLNKESAADAVVSGSTSGAPVNRYRYYQDPALGFTAGAWMRLPIAKRLAANIGLAYAQWSTFTPVGQSLPDTGRLFNNGTADFTASIGYTQGNQDEYRNRYHLLQVPLDLSWQLNHGKKLPLLWEIGISPGVLLSSNALVRDSARALFSHPDNQRRFQLGLRSAFLFRLMPSSARPLELGPVFQYQFNQVFTESARDNGHLYFLGVEARMPVFFFARKQRGKL